MVKPNITPLGNKVLIQTLKREERTQSGVIIPVVVNKDIAEAVVLLTSPDVLHVKPGDRIMYPTAAGMPVSIDNVDYRFICGPVKDAPGDIIAVYEEKRVKPNF